MTAKAAAHNRRTGFGEWAVAFKLAVVFMLLLVVGSLFSGLFFLYRDKGNGDRVVRALTVRVSLSLLLFLGLLLAWHFGAVGR